MRRLAELLYPDEALSGGENAQTEREQDPPTEVAASIVVIVKLLADLTVDLVPTKTETLLSQGLVNTERCVL